MKSDDAHVGSSCTGRRSVERMAANAISISGEEGLTLINEACDRNAPVELHYTNGANALTVARSRVLGTTEEMLYLDRPQCIKQEVGFRNGQILDAYFSLHGSLYWFRATVLSPELYVELNARKRVLGMSLTLPTKVKPGQRRRCFRASTIGIDEIIVNLHFTNNEIPDVTPIDAGRFRGILVDLSIGGAGLAIEQHTYSRFRVGDLMFLRLPLPDRPQPFYLLTQVRQSRPLHEDGGVRLGLQFEHWPSARRFSVIEHELQKFVTDLQRRQVRRPS
jgi:c-di-GMP-binding flagellar brake protein YcgR